MTVLVETFLGKNFDFPGTSDSPMRPVFYKHPVTGEEVLVHHNDRNLHHDREYEDAGFEYVMGKGWCWPVDIETAEETLPFFVEQRVYYIDRCVVWGEYVALSAENMGRKTAYFDTRKEAEEWIAANRPGGGYIVREEWVNAGVHYD